MNRGSGNLTNFSYDASQNRIRKQQVTATSDTSTYYIRDAQGTVLAVYRQYGSTVAWQEQHLYGSSRVGSIEPGVSWTSAPAATPYFRANPTLRLGTRRYELTDHLGNVRALIGDRRTLVNAGNAATQYYSAAVLNGTDYFPFGSEMRSSTLARYRYGFNGKELDRNKEFGILNQYDYGFRIYNPGIGRFLSVDPLMGNYPASSPYNFVDNNPIIRVDPDGKDWIVAISKVNGKTMIKLTFAGAIVNNSGKPINIQNLIKNQVKQFEAVFGQGNVIAKLLVREVNSASEIRWHESLIDIQAGKNFKTEKDGKFIGGNAKYGGKYIKINADGINIDGSLEDNKTIIHEIGHTGGLMHTWEFGSNEKRNFVNGNPFSEGVQTFFNSENDIQLDANFMNYTSKAVEQSSINPMLSIGEKIKYFNKNVGKATKGQIQQIINNLYKGNLNSEKDIPKK